MRSVGGLHRRLIDRETLNRAVWLAARHKRNHPVVRNYVSHLDEELSLLHKDLEGGQLRCGECMQFTIHDPKQRVITAPVFRERVLHHAVMDVCGPALERRLTSHCYACRPGKGALLAVHVAQRLARRFPWFLKADIRQYFASIDRERLLGRLHRVFREPRIRAIFEQLVYAYGPDQSRGLPIGTLVSQHLANFYLAALDDFVLQDLRPRAYVRYMDDFVLWEDDKKLLQADREKIGEFVWSQLRLRLKDEPFINRSARGLAFLGYRVFPRRIGMGVRSKRRFQRRMRVVVRKYAAGERSEMDSQAHATALVAFAAHADCLKWRRRVINDLGEKPSASSACCAAAHGRTTARTAGPPTATATRLATRTRTSAFVPSYLQREEDP